MWADINTPAYFAELSRQQQQFGQQQQQQQAATGMPYLRHHDLLADPQYQVQFQPPPPPSSSSSTNAVASSSRNSNKQNQRRRRRTPPRDQGQSSEAHANSRDATSDLGPARVRSRLHEPRQVRYQSAVPNAAASAPAASAAPFHPGIGFTPRASAGAIPNTEPMAGPIATLHHHHHHFHHHADHSAAGSNTKRPAQAATRVARRARLLRFAKKHILQLVRSTPHLSCKSSQCDCRINPGSSLWHHVTACDEPLCTVFQCEATKAVLRHYVSCVAKRCSVCEPARAMLADLNRSQQLAHWKAVWEEQGVKNVVAPKVTAAQLAKVDAANTVAAENWRKNNNNNNNAVKAELGVAPMPTPTHVPLKPAAAATTTATQVTQALVALVGPRERFENLAFRIGVRSSMHPPPLA